MSSSSSGYGPMANMAGCYENGDDPSGFRKRSNIS